MKNFLFLSFVNLVTFVSAYLTSVSAYLTRRHCIGDFLYPRFGVSTVNNFNSTHTGKVYQYRKYGFYFIC